jgi:glycosyltransferase involved in cell wall biosynthesis
MKAICRDSSFMISPSAGEGQSGAVIDAMHLGLIPLVSRECGVDTNGFGITLQSCELDEIKKVLVQTSTFSPERCEEMSMAANAAARTDYSQQAFSRRWREILEDVTRVG